MIKERRNVGWAVTEQSPQLMRGRLGGRTPLWHRKWHTLRTHLTSQRVTRVFGLSMPKPYPGLKVCNLHVFRGENVQAAHAQVPKCAGCTDQVGTKVCTPAQALSGMADSPGPCNLLAGELTVQQIRETS